MSRASVVARFTAALLGVTALLAGVTACGSSTAPTSASNFVATTREAGVVTLDVRTPAEFAAGHLEVAQNIPVESADFASRISGLDKSVTYAIYCRTGRRALIAADQMRAAGFTSLVVFESGGFDELAAAGAAVASG